MYRRQASLKATCFRLGLLVLLGGSGSWAGFALISWHDHGGQLLSVQTGSMVPTFWPGDALLVQKVKPSNLKVGEVISYRSTVDPRLIISHRLISVNKKAGTLTTKGDHLSQPDPSVHAGQLVGQVTAVAPHLGRVLNFLRKPVGLVLVIYVPAALIAGNEIRRLNQHYARQHYRLSGYHKRAVL